MKLHLPISLRRSLLLTFTTILTTASSSLYAAVMHADVPLLTYTDFGQNMGRFAAGPTNALLTYIRQQEGGVVISTYTGGQPPFTMPHGMIDFSSQNDGGYGGAIGYNWYSTVEHNGVHNNTYVGNFIGGTGNAVHYVGIEYRQSENNIFRHVPNYDYKITRQSKLLTDVTGATVYGTATGDYSGIYDKTLAGQLLYRAGSGKQAYFSHDGVETTIEGGYITGSVAVITSVSGTNQLKAFTVYTKIDPSPAGVNASNPLPYVGRGGDSGSPAYVWNDTTQQYEYIAAAQGVTKDVTYLRGASEWTQEVMDSYNVTVAMPTDSAVHIQGIYRDGETLSDSTNGVSTTLHYGKLTDDQGNDLLNSEGHVIEYRGVTTGINTWRDLSGIKDLDKWYTYGANYLNSTPNGQGADMNYADLYNTDNLVFVAQSSQEQQISVDTNVDLGLGYVHLRKAEGVDSASFSISSANQGNGVDFLLNSAGYVVDEGVSLHLQLTNPADYMREWRKIGEGDLYIEGSGDNNILLNLGGNGTTYLQRENGYSAYNVLANNGTRVVIKDVGQIKRDFTFGFRGGVLDMNGLSMTWNNDNKPESEGYDPTASGFAIHALDEHAIISNASGESTLTWTQGGNQTWLGSFTDTATGSLKFIYNGGADASLTMHSIHTDLTNHPGSGIEVASGTVRLVGTNTLHSMYPWEGAVNGRYFNKEDWHYADSSADIAIRNGGVFELGSHARLAGDITIESGGTFIMREGVQQQYEYIEGGYTAEDTYKFRDFYGLKGNISTESGATVRIAYSEGTSSANIYSGNITGGGNVEVDLGVHGGTLTLEGADSNYSGSKALVSGTLIATANNALGSVAGSGDVKWKISEKGVLASRGFVGDMGSSDIMAYIDASSSGVLALTADRTMQLDEAGQYGNLYIGALSGCNVSYGTLNTSEALTAYAYGEGQAPNAETTGYWHLGGGGGNLTVNFLLTGNNDLILGNAYGKGQVTLTNIGNNFKGRIIFNGAITLNYEDERVLGKSTINLDYSTRIPGETQFNNLVTTAQGVVLITEDSKTRNYDFAAHQNVSIASDQNLTFSGTIALAAGADYHFGGGSGTLTVDSDLETGHNLIIDAQTYNGGTIILKDLADISGNVLISGYDETKTALREGDVTLKLLDTQTDIFKDNAVTLKHGGMIDIAGTTQTFIDLETEEGSLVRSSLEGAAGTVVLMQREDPTVTEGETTQTTPSMHLAGSFDVEEIIISGQGTVELGGTNSYSNLRMQNGTVKLISDGALSGRAAWLENTASLHLNAHTVAGNLYLKDGATVNANVAGSGVAASGAMIAAQGTGHIQAGGTTFTVSGDIGAAEGATLALHGNSFSISGEHINASQGTLSFVDSATINLATATQTFGGTFQVIGGTTITNAGWASNYTFDTLHINGSNGKAVTFTTKWVLGWSSSVLTVEHMEGDGLFVWDPSCYSTGSSRTGLLRLTGEGNFSGVMRIKASGSQWGPLSRYAELTNDRALQNATVDLVGLSGNGKHVALAVNTGNAQFKGLTGNSANAYVYAGTASSSTNPASPVSTRESTLTFTGDGAYAFHGSVGLNDGGTANGISLVMAGSGTQSFTGDTVIVNDVEVQKGTLQLEASNILNIRGDISVSQGAELVSGQALTLGEGKTISVLASDAAEAATISAPSLTLAGGDLSFSAKAFFNESVASLQGLQSVHAADGTNSLVINIIDTSSLANRSYLLASGDWSALASGFTFTATGMDYLSASFTASSSGLILTLTPKDNHFIWNGTDAAHSWTDLVFDERQLATDGNHTVIFNNQATNKNVEIGASVTVGSILFDNSAGNTYTLTAAAAGNSITAADVTKRGDGNAVVNAELAAGTLTVEDGILQLNRDIEAHAIVLRNNGSLETVGSMDNVTNLSMSGNGSLRFMGGAPGSLSLSSFALIGGGAMSIGNGNIGVDSAANRYFTSDTTLTLTDSVLDDRRSSWRMANSTFSLAGNGTLYVDRIRLSDQQSSAISTLNIGQGFSLIITGESAGTTSNADGNFALSLWATPTKEGNILNIDGSLTSNAPIAAWDSAATINIREGGTLNLLKGLVRNTGRSHAVTINAGNGSRLNVGNSATGNNLTAANLPVNLLTGSTLGVIGSNVTLSKSFTLGSATQEGVVTIDTNYSTAATDGSLAVQQGDVGGIITLSGNISSYNTTGLAIVGKGEVISSNALAIGHDLLVKDTSTLTITGAFSANGGISVASGATLLLNGATLASDLTLSSGTLGISGETHLNGFGFHNSGTISLADNASFDLDLSDFALNDDGTYTYVFSKGTGTVNHSDSRALSDIFLVNGFSLTSMGEGQYSISRDNGLAITLSIKEITWAGGAGHTWETENAAWQRKDNSLPATFHNMDTVTFGLNGQQKTVSLAGDKTVNHMQVEAAGYTFEGSAHAINIAGNLTLTQEATDTAFNTGLAVIGNLDIAGESTFSQAVSVGGLLTVGGTARFNNGLSVANPITVTGTLGLAALADTDLAYRIDASQGSLSFDTQGHALTYNSGSLRAGSLQITGGGSLATNMNNLHLPHIELGEGTTLQISNARATDGANKSFGDLRMENGAVLAIYDANIPTAFTTIGKIILNGGTATVTDTNHSGYNRINALSGTGTLQFSKASQSNNGSVYELGSAGVDPGDFSGNIVLRSVVPDDGRRSATLVISNGDIAKNAVVTLDSTNSADSAAVLGLGIHADTVTLAGLASNQTTGSRAIVYSGTLAANTQLNSDDACTSFDIGDTETVRTLAIITDAAYTYYGRLLGNLNIVKGGSGTQTFAGDFADFNGSISVEGGTLALTGSLTTSNAITVGASGHLALGGALTLNAPITSSGSVTLMSGANIALNLGDFTHGSYTVVSGGTVAAADSDFASKFSIDGRFLADMGGSQYAFNTAGGGLTLTLNGFWAGTEEQHTWSDTQFGPLANTIGTNDIAFFTDEATCKEVSLAANVRVHHAEFDSSQTYRVTASGSGLETLAADKISQIGTGETHIDAIVNATDVAVEQGALFLGSTTEIAGTLAAAANTRLYVAYADIHSLSLGQNATIGSTGDWQAFALADTFSFAPGGTLTIDKTSLTVHQGVSRQFANVTQTINLTNGAVLDDRQGYYRVSSGKLSIEGGGTMYIKGFCLNSDANNYAQDYANSTRLSVKNDSSLIVTGSAPGQVGDFSLSSWKGYTYMDIDGTVTSNAILSTWDSVATVNVQGGGTMNLLKGLSRTAVEGNRTFAINLSIASGARLNAAGGSQNAYLPVTLQAGSTLGAIGENVAFSNNFALAGDGAVTLDTTYSTADDAFLVTQGTQGGTITLSGSITAGAGTTLAIVGNGTANFTGNDSSSFAGAIDVQSGATLAVNDSGKSIISAANSVTFGNGVTLDLSAISFDEAGTHAITLADNATASFSGNNTLNLGHLEDGSYQIFQPGANGSIEGWQSLAVTIGGSALSSRKVVNLGTDGMLTFHTDKLLWRGSDSSSWAMNDQGNWRLQSNNSATSFQSGDSVVFDDNATASRHVHVADSGATAENVFVTATGYTFSGGAMQVTGDLNISSSGSATFIPGNLTVGGTLAVEGSLTLDMDSGTSLSYNIDASNGGTVIFDTTSAITYNSGALKADTLRLTGGSLATNMNNLHLPHIELGEGTTLQISNARATDGANKSFGDLRMENGAVLAIYDANIPTAFTTIGKIILNGGTATVTDTNHSGYNRINALSGTGTLQFSKASQSNNGSVYELGSAGIDPGDFSGNIILRSVVSSSGRRSATLVISNGNIAKNAVVTLDSTNASAAMLGLGIHADTVTLAGLASNQTTGSRAIVYSGTLGNNTALNEDNGVLHISDNSTRRTISINTADATSYTYYGRFLNNLNIVKGGNGTQTFVGASADFDGAISIVGGTLAFNAASKGMLSTASSVTVGSGATLDLSSIAFDENGTNAISLAQGHNFIFDANSTLALGELDSGTYQIFNTENGGSVNWTSLTRENLTLAGLAPSSGVGISINTNGSITISLEKQDLVWNNSASSPVWDYSSESWMEGNNSSSFDYRDSVRFDSNASGDVKVASDILVANVTFDAGSNIALHQQNGHTLTADTLTINGTLSTDFGLSVRNAVSGNGKLVLLKGARQGLAKNQLGSLSVEVKEGATLAISDTGLGGFAWSTATTLEGQGTVEVSLSSNYGNTINVGAAFAGTTYVKSGNFTINSSQVGSALRMANGVNMQLGGATTFNGNLILEGTTQIHQNSGANFTIDGSLTGTGTYDRCGGGTLTVNGKTNLANFKVDRSHFKDGVANHTNIFQSEATLGNISINASTVSVEFKNNATITNGLAVHTGTGNTVDFNGNTSSVTGDVALSGNNTIQFASSTIRANVSANIRNATIEAKKAQSGENLNLLKISGDAQGIATVDGADIDIAAATKLELADVVIGAGTSITGEEHGNSTIVFNRATVTLPYHAAAPAVLNDIAPLASAENASGEALTLTQTGTTGKTCIIPAGTDCYVIAASNLAAAAIAGSSLTFDVSSYAADLESYDLFSIVFEDGVTFSDPSFLTITATTGTETYAGFYDSHAEGAPVVYFGKATEIVPEPTTTALGLIALASMATRRRRRG